MTGKPIKMLQKFEPDKVNCVIKIPILRRKNEFMHIAGQGF